MTIDVMRSDGVLRLKINRPERKNAFTEAMYETMYTQVRDAATDDAVRVLVIEGLPGVFSAGNDLDAFTKGPIDVTSAPVFQFLRVISTFPKPVVACVRGVAVGIGTTLLMHCDFVYANETAKFSMPFVSLGLCPEAASSLLFPLLAGYPRAAEMLLLGEMITVTQAYESRLLTAIVPDADIDAKVEQTVQRLLALPINSLVQTKRLMRSHLATHMATTIEVEAAQFSSMLGGGEVKEACQAFMEKRKPDFSRFNG